MIRGNADETFDAFLALEPHTTLSASEYHAIVRVLLHDHPRTRTTARRTLAVIEHAKKARSHAQSANHKLVYAELDELVRDAFLWNCVLASIASRQRHVPRDALDELFDVFAAGESAAAGDTHLANRFPNIVSYNTLLHAVVCHIPTTRTSGTAARTLHTEKLFEAAWDRLARDEHVVPDSVSWTTRIAFYTRTGKRGQIAECVKQMNDLGLLTTPAINAALWAYIALWRIERQGDVACVEQVYAHMKASQPLESTGVPTLPTLPRAELSVATCALLIRVLAARGNLSGALNVMHDLVAINGDTPASVYHTLFHGFARYGRSARLVSWHTDPANRKKSPLHCAVSAETTWHG
ncbi:hypothetical protein MCUN1_002005 [Malassezia cuniculi]|uniref:Pentatricopeptide repeat-containing protein n=1 Tax=Malassezia cuniculi TaxID=948313 RepID=A0AAF0ERF7_9BASI|nr:hypothetical protein MCUN1_002005 [Malassezia cuniculi]